MSDINESKKLFKKVLILIAILLVLSFGFRLINSGSYADSSLFNKETKEEAAKREAIARTNARIRELDATPRIYEIDSEEDAKKNKASASSNSSSSKTK